MIRQLATDVAVVGAGPAGLAAALEVARTKGRVLVLDENAGPGGQIFRQPPAAFGSDAAAVAHAAASPTHRRGLRLLAACADAGVEIIAGATVFDASPGRLGLEVEGSPVECRWQRLVLAPGAFDRSVAFSGWTLPGVITAGAAQVLVRGFLLRPGTRAVVAGTGPLLLPTVAALAGAGVEVVAALEAAPRSRLLRALPAVLGSRSRRAEALHYWRVLRRGRVPYRPGWAVFAAEGEAAVRAVTVGRVDRAGRPRRASARRLECDLLCVGFGLLPSTELAALLGCAMRYRPRCGGWVPHHDEQMETSIGGVYVAGEIAGIGGAEVALAEGTLAGLAAAVSLGLGTASGALDRAQRCRARERRSAAALLRCFPVPPGLCALATGDTVICRCEDVTLAQLEAGIALHGRDLRAAKMATRAGMGPCQARTCGPLIADLLRVRWGARGPELPPSVQVPVKPVTLDTLVAE